MLAHFFILLARHVLLSLGIILLLPPSCLTNFDNMQCHSSLSLNSGWFSDASVYTDQRCMSFGNGKISPWLLSCHSLTVGPVNGSQEASVTLFVKWKWDNSTNLLGFLWGLNEVAEYLRIRNLDQACLSLILTLSHTSCRILGKLLNLLCLSFLICRQGEKLSHRIFVRIE